jgi:alpha-ketoglutarate-dependent taurine dioxygenase
MYQYFCCSTRQTMHSDYAYYEAAESPEWLMLYCLKPSEYGGETHILTVDSLREILGKYNSELLEKIQIGINWKYTGIDGDKVHSKPLLSGGLINWNYWQIKSELNTKEVMDVVEEFHDFLENIIVAGGIYDFSKVWKPGDCLIFNDKKALHGRSAFLGDRWLKDQAII